MMAMFGIDPEQREAPRKAGPRRYRSSFQRLIKGWGYDSNGPEGAVLKGWVESRFGIFPSFHKEPIGRISSGAWTTYVEEKMSSRFHNNAIYIQLDLLYEFCQWALMHFAAPGAIHLTLYRGVNAFDEHQIVGHLDKHSVVMRLNNLDLVLVVPRDRATASAARSSRRACRSRKVAYFNALLPSVSAQGRRRISGDRRRLPA